MRRRFVVRLRVVFRVVFRLRAALRRFGAALRFRFLNVPSLFRGGMRRRFVVRLRVVFRVRRRGIECAPLCSK